MSPNSIILVEDDNNLRHSIALILKHAGYPVTVTDCACAAMELLQTGEYQLVISDNNMAESRKVLIPGVRTNYPYLSILILTDQSGPEIESDEGRSDIQFLTKPVAPEYLLDCVGRILGIQGSSKLVNKNTNSRDPNFRYQ